MIRAVIDTSVLIRYLIKPSAAIKELIEVYWLGDQVQMVIAPELIAELEGVLGRNEPSTWYDPRDNNHGETNVLILNFAHPLTPTHLEQIQALTGEPVGDVIEAKTHFDNGQPFEPQMAALPEEA